MEGMFSKDGVKYAYFEVSTWADGVLETLTCLATRNHGWPLSLESAARADVVIGVDIHGKRMVLKNRFGKVDYGANY